MSQMVADAPGTLYLSPPDDAWPVRRRETGDERPMRSLALPALIGTLAGLALGLGTNVSGAVLALYGLLAGAAYAAAARAIAARRARRGGAPVSPVALALAAAAVAAMAVGALAVAAAVFGDGAERRAPVPADLPLGDRPAARAAEAPNADDPVAQEARPTQLPEPEPGEYRPGTARRAAAEFLDAWHDRAWDRMALWTAPLWRENLPDPAGSLRFRFGVARLRGAEQGDLRRLGPDRVSIVADLASTTIDPEIERRRVTMDVRRVDGRWGVEPISLAPPPAGR